MGLPVLVLGESGSGKTASLRNFNSDEVFIINVAGKELSFKNKNNLKRFDTSDYDKIKAVLLKAANSPDNKIKSFVLDDTQYLMAFESFARAKETGFTKNIDLAVHFKDLIQFVITALPRDFIVYFLHHIERTDDGHIKAKTLGKMLDSQLTVEGLFTNVIMTQVNNGSYKFLVHDRDGVSTVKTPLGMFEEDTLDNDLKLVDETLRSFYEFDKGE
jgi:hypothetical protein